MPWKVSDVDGHIKGLTDHQKTVWVAVADNVLAACLKGGGTDATCAPKAIRQANAVAAKAPKVKAASMAADIKAAIAHLKQAMAIHRKHLASPKMVPSPASTKAEMDHIKAALTALGETASMAATTKSEAGGNHPASHYLVVEDPSKPTTWHLRVKDMRGKVDHRLMGAAWAAFHGGYCGQKYSGPGKSDALQKLIALYKSEGIDTPAAMAAFAVELAAGSERRNGHVLRHGKLFVAGDYPDKQFAMTAGELAAAVAAFRPCPIDSEHSPSVFDGQLGQVEAVELCEDGQAICGAVAIPDWLDTLFAGQPIPVSTTWDRETKRLTGLALAKHPRVSDAAILAAFSASAEMASYMEVAQTCQVCAVQCEQAYWYCQQHGGAHAASAHLATLQDCLSLCRLCADLCARGSLLCMAACTLCAEACRKCAASCALLASDPVLAACQVVCETCATACSSMTGPAAMARFAGRRHNQNDQAALDAAHEAIVNAGAMCPGMQKESKMNRTERFFKWLAGETDDISLEAEDGDQDVQLAAQPDPRIDALEKQLAEQRAAAIQQSAITFADGAVASHRALPAERQALYEAYLLAATDDAAHGAVTFADGKTGTRVSRVEGLIAARPVHDLTMELIAQGAGGVLESTGDKAKMTDERRDALLAQTPLGQAALSARRNK